MATNCATTEETFAEILRRPGAVLLVAPDVYQMLQSEAAPSIPGLFPGIKVVVERGLKPGTYAAFDMGAAPSPFGGGGSKGGGTR